MEAYRNCNKPGNPRMGNSRYDYDRRQYQNMKCNCNMDKMRSSCTNTNSVSDDNDAIAMMRVADGGYKYGCKLASARVAMQTFENIYDAKTALCEGTIFPELNLIFCGVR